MSNYTSEAKRFSPCSFCKNSQDRPYTSLYGLPESTQIPLPLSRGEEDWLRHEIAGKLRDAESEPAHAVVSASLLSHNRDTIEAAGLTQEGLPSHEDLPQEQLPQEELP